MSEFVARFESIGAAEFIRSQTAPLLINEGSLRLDSALTEESSTGFHTEDTNSSSMKHRLAALSPEEINRIVSKTTELAEIGEVFEIRKRADGIFKDRIGVGRARNTDIPIVLPSISKYHAFFTLDHTGKHWLADAGSSNGTRLDGRRLDKLVPAELFDDAPIEFGPYRFRYWTPARLAEEIEKAILART